MVNFSEGSEEKEAERQNSASDIQFDELTDLDAIQQQLKQKIEKEKYIEEHPEEANLESEAPAQEKATEDINLTAAPPPPPVVEIDPNAKKYVIYIDSNNVDFMEGLSINERKSMINKILKEQNEAAIKTKELVRRKRFVTHIVIVVLTCIIGFPVMFAGVNKAMEIILTNYQTAKENFSKLYKEHGKIKPSDAEAEKNFKY